jgi:large subunit ribosomal protein L35
MPKVKTKSGAKKRFKVTGTGKVKRKRAYKNHILTKKETKQKRRLTQKAVVRKEDLNNVRLMLPYAV